MSSPACRRAPVPTGMAKVTNARRRAKRALPGAAIDTPEGLADRAGVAKRVRFVPSKPFDDHLVTTLAGVRRVEHEGEHVIVTGSGDVANDVIITLAAAGVTAADLHLDSANLEVRSCR